MTSLRDVHPVALAEIKKRFTLNPIALKHPHGVGRRGGHGAPDQDRAVSAGRRVDSDHSAASSIGRYKANCRDV